MLRFGSRHPPGTAALGGGEGNCGKGNDAEQTGAHFHDLGGGDGGLALRLTFNPAFTASASDILSREEIE